MSCGNYITIARKVIKTYKAQVQIMINTCTKFEFNPSTSWGSYARHRHNLLHGARSTTDIKPWHKHTTGELKRVKSKLHLAYTRVPTGAS